MSTSSFFAGGESPQTNIYEDEAQASALAAAQSAAQSATSAEEAAAHAAAALAVSDSLDDEVQAAQNSQTAAAASATSAAASATNASTSANTASAKAAEAVASADNASTSASTASTNATAASTSANAASASATNAAASAAAAATSATSASGSATTATTKASEASTSATNAAASASTATTKASEASTSATNAGTSASNAATSATAASGSATSASGSATAASGSATAAASSATAASGSATAAATAQTAAESARDATLAAFDSFDDRYLGSKTSNPTLDNDGNALVAGALYFNSTAGEMRVYTGSAWAAAYVSGTGVLLQANNLSDLASASTARTNLGLGNVENKSSATIRGEISSSNVTTALGYTPANKAGDTFTGNVGIGINPSMTLDVAAPTGATVRVQTTSTGNAQVLVNTVAGGAAILDLQTAAGLNRIVGGAGGTSNLGFYTASTERMRITSAGDVGIGTSSPASTLNVRTASGAAPTNTFGTNAVRLTSTTTAAVGVGPSILFEGQTGNTTASYGFAAIQGIKSSATLNDYSGSLAFSTQNNGGSTALTERMRIDGTGQVGIGVTPMATGANGNLLQIGNPTTNAGSGLTVGSTATADIQFSDATTGTGQYAGLIRYSHTSDFMALWTASAERLRINSLGDVGIGTASPDNYAGRSALSVNGSTGGIITLQSAGTQKLRLFTGASSSAIGTLTGTLDISTGDASAFTLSTNSAERMRITAEGNLGVGTSSPTNFGSTYRTIHVAGANTTNGGVFRSSNSDNSVVGDVFVDSTSFNVRAGTGTALSLLAGNTERLRISSTGGITSSDLADAVGYKGLPQNQQTSAYTLALSDMGKHISITTGGVVIPANGSVAFPIGATIVVFNNSGSTQTISITTDTLRQAGTANTGSRTLAQYGLATLVKVTSTVWAVSGNVT